MALESVLTGVGLYDQNGVLIAILDPFREYTIGRDRNDIQIGKNNLHLSRIQGKLYFNQTWYFQQLGTTTPTVIEQISENPFDNYPFIYEISFDRVSESFNRKSIEFSPAKSSVLIDITSTAPLRWLKGKTIIYMPAKLRYQESGGYGVNNWEIKKENSEILIFSKVG